MLKPHDALAYRRLQQLIQTRYGIVIPADREDQVRRNLLDASARLGASGLSELYDRTHRNDRAVIRGVLNAITVSHTSFFRERVAYEAFEQELLPNLDRPEVRIWSAASSSGEELYSVVMLVVEAFGLDAATASWRFLGTDINPDVIQQAERGYYSPAEVARLPSTLKTRYVQAQPDGHYQVASAIRALCTFRTLNLIEEPLPVKGPFDVIFCRNILYYFTEETQQQVLRALYRVTREGGWLITSSTESIDHLNTPWVRCSSVIHQRRPTS